MSAFLNPALLWFIPLAALPILLHLLTLHRLKTVELSTFRFLFDSYVQQRRRMRFLEALLAFLRTLFLLLLVAALGRPVVQHWQALFGTGSGRDVVMLIDCSASMNARSGGTSSLEQAKRVVQEVVKRLSPDDRVTVVRVGSKPEDVFSRFRSDEEEAIAETISNLRASPSRANFFAALNHVFGPRSGEWSNPVVYIFTDCQASGWREVEDQPLDKLLPEKAELIVVNVGPSEPSPNRAVLGQAPRERRAIVGLPVVLRPRVVNYSPTETEDVPVSVFIDQQEVARTTLTLKPGQADVREVVFTPGLPGVLKGRFEIPGDQFPDDDDFLFTLTVVPQVKVLLVNGNPAANPLDDETLYLRTALASTVPDEDAETTAASDVTSADGLPPATVAGLLPKKEFLRSLDVQEVPEPQLNLETLRDAKVVVLANCGALTGDQFNLLRDYVARGGGLLILPGDKVNPAQYNDQFFPVPGPQQERLTSVRLAAPEGDADKADSFERLASIDFAHPALTVFDNPAARYLATVRFFRRFPLTLENGAGNGWPLATFSNGAPALVESRFGDGTVQIAAFPASSRWTNLPLKPEFVPLVLRLVGHLEHRPELEVPSVVAADGAAEISVSDEWAPATGKVTGGTASAQAIELRRSGSRLVGAFEGTVDKGYYDVAVTDGRTKDAQGFATFAVNLAPEESRFEFAGREQFDEWLPGVKLAMWDLSAQAEQLHGPVGDEREVWRPVIVLMFVIIIIEFLLATLSGAKADNEEPQTVFQRIRGLNPGRWVGRMTGAGQMTEVN